MEETSIRLFPDQASVAAAKVDQLYLFLISVSAFFTALIFLLIVYFVIRYRRGSPASRRAAPTHGLGLELFWIVVPLVIVLVSFAWGATLFIDAYRPPPGAMEIQVVGKQWMWRV